MNSHIVSLWMIAVGLIATILFASAAKALRSFSRFELAEICRRRGKLDRFGEILRRHDRTALAIEHLLVFSVAAIVVFALHYWATLPEVEGGRENALFAEGAGLVVALLAARIWVPWAIVHLWAEPLLFYTWWLWRWTSRAMAPLLWSADIVDTLFHRLSGRTKIPPSEDSFEEEIRTIVSEGHREGLLEEDAREMIEGVIELGDADVSEIMTPRTDMHMVHVGLSWDEMLPEIIRLGHTRIPVYDKNRDDIIGILHTKDLLPTLTKKNGHPQPSLRDLLRRPNFVPETKAVDELLQEFQQTRSHIAVVLDEYGGVSGLVTIEDVLEEIVGEIVDEYDEETVEEIEKIDEDTCEALGRAHVDEINEKMGYRLPDTDEYDTIAGFVFSKLGRVPLPGDSLDSTDGVRITVLEATRRRIDRVRLERVAESDREIA